MIQVEGWLQIIQLCPVIQVLLQPPQGIGFLVLRSAPSMGVEQSFLGSFLKAEN